MYRLLLLAVVPAFLGAAGVGGARNADLNVDIVAVDISGRQTNLTRDPALDGSPAVARDGRIAFVSTRGGTPDLYVMNRNGRNVRRLTDSSSGVAWDEALHLTRRHGRRAATRSRSMGGTWSVGPTACVFARTGAFSS
jgi:Tol biopolymer transport system component